MLQPLAYRPEIDGLRAWAVVPVVLYHADIPPFSGGYLGVDVFFVISGYLIFSIIWRENEKGKFSLKSFYNRRVRRIIPCLYLVLIATLLLAMLTLDPRFIESSAASALAAVFFLSNLYFWRESGYFAQPAELEPLLHTWSLAVEEQFYIVFPIALIAIARWRPQWLGGALVAGLALSLALAEWGWRNAPSATFFLPFTRAWELLFGALLALLPHTDLRRRVGLAGCDCIVLLAIAVLLVCMSVFGESTPHPSLLTLLPVAAVGAVIVFAEEGGRVSRILLTPKPIIGVGLISYSLYLWHQPVFVFARFQSGEPLDPITASGLIGVSVLLSIASFRWIEQPFRDRHRITNRTIFAAFAGSTVAVCALALLWQQASSVPLRIASPDRFERYAVIEAIGSDERMVEAPCKFWSPTFTTDFQRQFDQCAERYGQAIFVTGGSHGGDLYNVIAAGSDYPFIVSVAQGYCRAHRMLEGRPPHRCHYEDLLEFAEQNADRIAVILYTQVPDRLYPGLDISGLSEADLSIDAIDEAVAYLAELKSRSGVGVEVIGMLPPLSRSPRLFNYWQPLEDQARRATNPHLIALSDHADQVFGDRARQAGLGYHPKVALFGLTLPDDVLVDGRLTYSDARHLSWHGEHVFAPNAVRGLESAGVLPITWPIETPG